MAHFVQYAEQAIAKMMPMETGRDPAVTRAQTRKERVRTGVEAPAPKVEAEGSGGQFSELTLTVERIIAMQERKVRSATRSGYGPDQFDQFAAQGIEQRNHLPDGDARLVLIEHGFVEVGTGSQGRCF